VILIARKHRAQAKINTQQPYTPGQVMMASILGNHRAAFK
jgi:hypothetical protein